MRLAKKLCRAKMVASAVFSAVRFRCRLAGKHCASDLTVAAWGMAGLVFSSGRIPKLGRLRIRHCATKCPFYDHKRRTCGHENSTTNVFGNTEMAGCGCFMPLKAGIPEATCWLNDRTAGEVGWPKHLQA
jgi:hypothetical protein